MQSSTIAHVFILELDINLILALILEITDGNRDSMFGESNIRGWHNLIVDSEFTHLMTMKVNKEVILLLVVLELELDRDFP